MSKKMITRGQLRGHLLVKDLCDRCNTNHKIVEELEDGTLVYFCYGMYLDKENGIKHPECENCKAHCDYVDEVLEAIKKGQLHLL